MATDPILILDERESLVLKLYGNRRLAHQSLFAKRKRFKSPLFHGEIIDRFHDKMLRGDVEIAFRGSAKSTLAEEAVTIQAGFRDFRHCVLVGATQDKARERLHAVRRQFEANEMVLELFGDLRGRPWTDDILELSTGIMIQAIGRGQAIRGTKSEDMRPDLIVADDIEDRESVRTPENREKLQSWFFTDLLPLGDEPTLRVIILSNDQHPECLANKLEAKDSGFEVHRYPWVHLDADGAEQSAWPERYSLKSIKAKEAQFRALGRIEEYNREYLCRSDYPEAKPFKREMFRIEPRVRTWQAVYGMFDPARSINTASADTGFASWSWVGPRMVVWDAWGKKLLPNEIVDEIVRYDEDKHPVNVGVDETGLKEFLMQPLRQRQVALGRLIPIQPISFRSNKVERIRGLMPFFNAREVEFACQMDQLEKQLLSFPAGKRDILDALATALVMRAGAPIYEDFGATHVVEGLVVNDRLPGFLVMNATHALLTAVLVQSPSGDPRILADWVMEGDPAELAPRLVQDALMTLGRMPKVIIHPDHFNKWNNVGLWQALNRAKVEVRAGTDSPSGRDELRQLLRETRRNLPAVMIGDQARFTLNALAGGYCRAIAKGGMLADFAVEGPYRVLMEGLESFMGLMRIGLQDEENGGINYQTTRDGRRYISARVTR